MALISFGLLFAPTPASLPSSNENEEEEEEEEDEEDDDSMDGLCDACLCTRWFVAFAACCASRKAADHARF